MRTLTEDETQIFLDRLAAVGDQYLPEEMRARINLITELAGWQVGAKLTYIALNRQPGVPEEIFRELSRLGKGSQPDEQCETCPEKDVCWEGAHSHLPQQVEELPTDLVRQIKAMELSVN